jgi:hypothetical protein
MRGYIMSVITGVVTKVTTGKGQVTTDHGKFDKLNITVKGEDGESLTIGKLAKVGNDGQGFVGKRVQVTYKTKQIETDDGDTKDLHSTDSKGFVQLDVPAFGGKPASGGSSPSTAPQTFAKTTYNSDGARHGMIVNNAVELAGLRKTLDLKSLIQAADDIKALTEYVEGKAPPVLEKAPKAKAKVTQDEDDDGEAPF